MDKFDFYFERFKKALVWPYLLIHLLIWSLVMQHVGKKYKEENRKRGQIIDLNPELLKEHLWQTVRSVPYFIQLFPTVLILYLIFKIW